MATLGTPLIKVKDRSAYKLETKLAQAGCEVDPTTGAVTPNIVLASTFERGTDLVYDKGYVYGRYGNPTRDLLEKTAASLEDGTDAAAFASGMAAASAIMTSIPEGHVVLSDDCYHAVSHILSTTYKKLGVGMTRVAMADLAAVEATVEKAKKETKGTVLVWLESPTNPLLRIADVAAVSAIAKKHGAYTVVDATFCTPYVYKPFEFGADLILHSCTKYFGGHSDLVGGIVISNGCPVFTEVRNTQIYCGGGMSPFDCWLTLRGLRSLGARMRLHCESGLAVAKFLEAHPAVLEVYYPGLESHPGYAVAVKQMKGGFGGMLSFRVKGGKEAAVAVHERVKVAKRATSLGGTETLIEHRASVETPGTTTPWDLLRMSIGLEHIDDIVGDLKQALDSVLPKSA